MKTIQAKLDDYKARKEALQILNQQYQQQLIEHNVQTRNDFGVADSDTITIETLTSAVLSVISSIQTQPVAVEAKPKKGKKK